ncbi:hypothetical protein [Mycobacteroides abscessus]|uniref:hypothetical protein n=1 Tax=Mycobacteroides abscessus TaxID=36809 RepID=UPI000C26794F|nr:hypothetical protein [Mycobacteroides abscessus]RIT97462.1 hypothetical protein D2F00_17070 [Mycobacteroides abscessus]
MAAVLAAGALYRSIAGLRGTFTAGLWTAAVSMAISAAVVPLDAALKSVTGLEIPSMAPSSTHPCAAPKRASPSPPMVSRDLADTLAERYPDAPETVEYHEQLRTIADYTKTAQWHSCRESCRESMLPNFALKDQDGGAGAPPAALALRPAAAASAARRGVPT